MFPTQELCDLNINQFTPVGILPYNNYFNPNPPLDVIVQPIPVAQPVIESLCSANCNCGDSSNQDFLQSLAMIILPRTSVNLSHNLTNFTLTPKF
ncbi:hypothetical protein BpHYR1_022495 [Brachionus plicatilis]|uniref:Uncharacterized protein n=1 Tax=Brachionus plicatilis TaxID=10195 RepID=A0A3M7R4F0_BRAPC|nr:hypothetical protein BpHYR1_022495 [Brachionus plicatilis]